LITDDLPDLLRYTHVAVHGSHTVGYTHSCVYCCIHTHVYTQFPIVPCHTDWVTYAVPLYPHPWTLLLVLRTTHRLLYSLHSPHTFDLRSRYGYLLHFLTPLDAFPTCPTLVPTFVPITHLAHTTRFTHSTPAFYLLPTGCRTVRFTPHLPALPTLYTRLVCLVSHTRIYICAAYAHTLPSAARFTFAARFTTGCGIHTLVVTFTRLHIYTPFTHTPGYTALHTHTFNTWFGYTLRLQVTLLRTHARCRTRTPLPHTVRVTRLHTRLVPRFRGWLRGLHGAAPRTRLCVATVHGCRALHAVCSTVCGLLRLPYVYRFGYVARSLGCARYAHGCLCTAHTVTLRTRFCRYTRYRWLRTHLRCRGWLRACPALTVHTVRVATRYGYARYAHAPRTRTRAVYTPAWLVHTRFTVAGPHTRTRTRLPHIRGWFCHARTPLRYMRVRCRVAVTHAVGLFTVHTLVTPLGLPHDTHHGCYAHVTVPTVRHGYVAFTVVAVGYGYHTLLHVAPHAPHILLHHTCTRLVAFTHVAVTGYVVTLHVVADCVYVVYTLPRLHTHTRLHRLRLPLHALPFGLLDYGWLDFTIAGLLVYATHAHVPRITAPHTFTVYVTCTGYYRYAAARLHTRATRCVTYLPFLLHARCPHAVYCVHRLLPAHTRTRAHSCRTVGLRLPFGWFTHSLPVGLVVTGYTLRSAHTYHGWLRVRLVCTFTLYVTHVAFGLPHIAHTGHIHVGYTVTHLRTHLRWIVPWVGYGYALPHTPAPHCRFWLRCTHARCPLLVATRVHCDVYHGLVYVWLRFTLVTHAVTRVHARLLVATRGCYICCAFDLSYTPHVDWLHLYLGYGYAFTLPR